MEAMKARGFTRSRRCYAYEMVERRKKRKEKDGDLMAEPDQEALGQIGPKKNKLVTKKEVTEFLRIVKHIEYSVLY